MDQRPKSVTIVCWVLIAMAVLSLVFSFTTFNDPAAKELMSRSPLSLPVQWGIMIAGMIVTVLSAIVMLKGKKWGRTLYVVWSVVGFTVGFLTSPIKTAIIPGLVIFGVIVFFLFRPQASTYLK